MMYKKKKGFSLAELLISLLVISIVLAAAIPTITKRNSAGSEKIWHWAGANNSVYSAIGANQSVMIGSNQMPHREDVGNAGYYDRFFPDDDIEIPADVNDRPFFTTDGDKLVLLKRSLGGENQTDNFLNSHISFYNLENSSDATTRDITYAGRIATDKHNLAFGIGSLQQLRTADRNNAGAFKGYNTAVGHYSLFYNTFGERNTAIGEKALTYNLTGSDNTALGYNALKSVTGNNNTAIGSNSMQINELGVGNTAVGSYALRFQDEGSYNTALGSGACSHVVGNHNICIGFASGGGMEPPTDADLIYDDNYLIIGNDSSEDGGAPLVEGHTSYLKNGTKEKNFNVNARFFNVQPFDGSAPILQVIANSGTLGDTAGIGYDKGDGHAKYGDFRFTLKEVFGTGDSLQLRMTGKAQGTDREVQLYGLDHHDNGVNPNYADFNFNNSLYLTMDDSSNNYVGIKSADDKTLGLQKTIFIEDGAKDSAQIWINKDGQTDIKSKIVQINADDYVSLNSAWISFSNAGTEAIGIDTAKGDVYAEALVSTKSGSSSLADTVSDIYSKIQTLETKITSGYSDARLKNISGDNTAGLKEINALEVKNYTYKNDKEKTPHVGVIAQQLQKVFPNSVTKDEDGYLKIRTEEIFYAMVNSIKELFTQIQDLTAKITGLDKRISELEAQNKALKKQNEEFEKRLAKLEKQAAK